jgi:hypothetical protein
MVKTKIIKKIWFKFDYIPLAAGNSLASTIQILLDAGAKTDILNNLNLTAVDIGK